MNPRTRTDLSLRVGSLLFFLLFVLTLTQCHLQPRGVMDSKELKSVVRDMLLLDATYGYSRYPGDSLYRLRQEALFHKHGTTRAEYDSTMVWYAANAHLLTKIYDELAAEFQEKGVLLDSAIVDSTELYRLKYTQTPSLWSYSSRFSIRRTKELYYRSQTVPGVTLGDTLDFKAAIYPPLSGSQELQLTLLVKDTADIVRHRRSVILKPGLEEGTSFILPDNLGGYTAPPNVEFYFLYRNPGAMKDTLSGFPLITFDSVALYKRLPSPPPVISSDETFPAEEQ